MFFLKIMLSFLMLSFRKMRFDAGIQSGCDGFLAITDYEDETFVTVIKLRSEGEWRIDTQAEVNACHLTDKVPWATTILFSPRFLY